jgi:hypothetical protein
VATSSLRDKTLVNKGNCAIPVLRSQFSFAVLELPVVRRS